MSNKTTTSVMACIADRPDCNRIMKAAAGIAAKEGLPLTALTVLPSGHMSGYATERLQVLYNITERYSAELLVLFSDSPALTVAVTAQQKNVAHLVVGTPQSGLFIETVKALLPEVPMTVIPDDKQKIMVV